MTATSLRPAPLDVLVIGAGAAGLYTALCLPETWRVGLACKDDLQQGASRWAQGGIAAAIGSSDSPKQHFQDTIRAGGGLCIPETVRLLVEAAPERIRALQQWGVTFDREGSGLAATLEAAHSQPRILHVSDETGRAIVEALSARVLERDNIQLLSPAVALNLVWDAPTGRCQGADMLWAHRLVRVPASAVVLATGGGGQAFARTTNPPASTGDGMAMAWRAGAQLRDMEFVQFHPTTLAVPGAGNALLSEAARGEGAHLIDARGHRFAFDYHPDGELAPRDAVSRAIFERHRQAGDGATYLDLRPIPPQRLHQRFPNLIRQCQRGGLDPQNDPIPVAPAAHYWMGGVAADLGAATTLAGVYAVGETAHTGVHGANRLASNSLLECLVFGGQLAAMERPPAPRERGSGSGNERPLEVIAPDWAADARCIDAIRAALPPLLWERAGICREGRSLEDGLAQVRAWRRECERTALGQQLLAPLADGAIALPSQQAHQTLRCCIETLNLLDLGQALLQSALARTESRGAHYRTDYPQTDPHWQRHVLLQRDRCWRSPPL
ncbi:MAG: L-aspartate oxidase [Cyanobacteria bacterium QS_8_64_29]|nr:MAG: L-aspartate oxidase [Cyanobacteria bacterium QS_8_64_29]